MPRATAQIVIQLDPESGQFRAEMPSPNGARRKLDLPTDPSLWGDLIGVELLELNTWLRDQEHRATELREFDQAAAELKAQEFAQALHRKVSQTSASRKGQGVEFAKEKFHQRPLLSERRSVMEILSQEKE